MSEGRRLRHTLGLVYLAGLAVALAFTSLSAPAIVGVMLVGWALLAGAEWAASRARPHYGAGLPPRWRAPAAALPPAQPLEQVAPGYPESQRDEAATWIASAALRDEVLGDWPLYSEPEEELEPEAEPADTEEAAPDPWLVAAVALPPVQEREPDPEPEPVAVVALAEPEPEPEREAVAAEPPVRMARYHVDPFAEPDRKRFRRSEPVPSIDVPARPLGPRPLPRSLT